jgi:hypothetical protein
MDGSITQLIITTVITTIAAGAVGAMGGRLSVKTKTQMTTENLDKRVEGLERTSVLQLKTNLAILLALKRGKVNGECEEALDELNKYLCERK